MQNSGSDRVYYGGRICKDGDILYVSYYGTLYIFHGNEVLSYPGGGTSLSSMAEVYLYNGYAYYTNLSNQCIYRMNVADGSREILLSGKGEIQETFMYGKFLYVSTVSTDDDYRRVYYALDLDAGESHVLLQEESDAHTVLLTELTDRHFVVYNALGNTMKLSLLDAATATVQEIHSSTLSESEKYHYVYNWKNSEEYLHLDIPVTSETEDTKYVYYKISHQDFSVVTTAEEEYTYAVRRPENSNEWLYYISIGKNLCRQHKESKVVEVLAKGSASPTSTVYTNQEILYADDSQIVFSRYRMANGAEFSLWIVDSDGRNLWELIRNPYYSDTEIFPIGVSTGGASSGGTSSGSSASSGGDDPAVGTKTCALCGGDGQITCYYCKGSGKGTTIYVMGIPTEQGCSYCGSSGWRVCSGCGGHGVK